MSVLLTEAVFSRPSKPCGHRRIRQRHEHGAAARLQMPQERADAADCPTLTPPQPEPRETPTKLWSSADPLPPSTPSPALRSRSARLAAAASPLRLGCQGAPLLARGDGATARRGGTTEPKVGAAPSAASSTSAGRNARAHAWATATDPASKE